jgi:hypothetical protein
MFYYFNFEVLSDNILMALLLGVGAAIGGFVAAIGGTIFWR